MYCNFFYVCSIPSYGDRANTYDAVIDYFRTHFLQVHRKNNEEHRVLYTHQTSVVDTSTTQSVIRNGEYSYLSVIRTLVIDAALVAYHSFSFTIMCWRF